MANVQEFLEQYFGGLKTREATRQFSVEQAFNQTKLSNEMQEHQDAMAQQAQEFTSKEHYQNAMISIAQAKEERERKNEIQDNLQNFYKAGGFTQPTATDSKPFDYQTGGGQNPGLDVSFLGGPKPPVGPAAPGVSGTDLIQGLPLRGAPAIPMQGQLSTDAQRPDPSIAGQVPTLEGMPKGVEAFQQTDLGKKLDAIQAKRADYIDTPDQVKQWFGGGLPDKMDMKDITGLLEARQKDLESRSARQDNNELRRDLATQADDTKRFLGVLIAQGKVGATPEQVAANHEGVMNNPDSFHELSAKEKTLEREELKKEGLPPPVKLNPTQNDQEQYARRARTSIENIRSLLADPTMLALIKRRSGAIMGRVGDVEQDVGATTGLSPDQARKIQDFRASVRYLVFQEGKALFGSRIPIQLMKELQSTSPKTTESIDMLKGSMDAVNRNAENTLISDENTRFGGKMRPDFYERNNIKGRNGTKEVEIQNFPYATKLQDGVPQVFSNKTNDRTIVKRGSKTYEVVDK